MNLKSRLLEIFENSEGEYLSGAILADKLSVSRNAVWKAVKSLRDEGYGITAATNKGYCLDKGGDILSQAGISKYLKSGTGPFEIEVYKSVTSTNTVLKEIAAKGAPEGMVIAAEEQTAGKGRLGRSFFSPAGRGAYFSLLLRPDTNALEASLITAAAAAATAKAIEEITGLKTGIKWVNDIFIGGKKVCGILTEAAFDMERGCVESAVLGIGINVIRPETGFPTELDGIVTALSDMPKAGIRNRLIAEILSGFWNYYKDLSSKAFLDEYRSRSILFGRDITVISAGGQHPARALEIDDDCRLVVRYASGETETLNSGEVSIRYEEI